jgi:serralysin
MKSLFVSFSCLAASLSVALTGIAGEWQSTELARTSYFWGGRVSGANAAWVGDGHPCAAYFYNGTTVRQLADNVGTVDLSGSNVAWLAAPTDVFLWDGATTRQLTSGVSVTGGPKVSGASVAWMAQVGGVDQVFLCNRQTTTQISNDQTVKDELVGVSGPNVLWTGQTGTGGLQLFLYDGASTIQLGNNVEDDSYALSGNKAAWVQRVGGVDQVFLYDGQSTRQITNYAKSAGGAETINMDGTNVVWDWKTDSGSQVYFYDGTNVRRLTAGLLEDMDPVISGSNVAWIGSNALSGDLFLYDGSLVSRVTDDGLVHGTTGMSGQMIGWWGWQASSSSYMFNLAAPVPEPSSLAMLVAACAVLGVLVLRRRNKRERLCERGD